MKKLITFMMSLLIMTTMTGTSIHADDTGTITEDGGSSSSDVDSEESVTNNCLTDEDVFKVTVSWNIAPGTYARTDDYAWNADELRYDILKNGTKGESKTTDGTAKITLTNYSNTDVDYAIFYESKKVDEKAITSEKPTTQGTDLPSGTVASAATVETMEGTGNTAKEMIYNGTIEFADDYTPDNGDNSKMGTYTIKVSKHLVLDKTALTIKTGRTYTSLKASTQVTWSSSNTNVATVDDNGKVTTIADGTANIVATSKVTGMTAICKVTAASSGAYFLHDSQDDFDLLLATTDIVSYTDPDGKTVYAYNGFIKETSFGTWSPAKSFVKALNDNSVKPTITEQGTEGTWRLIKSQTDAINWAKATNGTDSAVISEYKTKFNSVYYLWSNTGTSWQNDFGAGFNCNTGKWCDGMFYRGPDYGFLVIWEPAN